jgi:hypothetical protein
MSGRQCDNEIYKMIREAARYKGAVLCYLGDTNFDLSSAIPAGLTSEETRAVIRSAVDTVCDLLIKHNADIHEEKKFTLFYVYDEEEGEPMKYMNCWVLQMGNHEEHIIDLYSCYKNIDRARKRKRVCFVTPDHPSSD